MVRARAVDATGADEEGVHLALRCRCEDESVTGAVGRIGRVDFADVVRIAVVEGVVLRDVSAELAVVDEISCAAEMKQDGFARDFSCSDAFEDGLGHGHVEGGGAVDDDAVGSGEFFEVSVLFKGAVYDGDVA